MHASLSLRGARAQTQASHDGKLRGEGGGEKEEEEEREAEKRRSGVADAEVLRRKSERKAGRRNGEVAFISVFIFSFFLFFFF